MVIDGNWQLGNLFKNRWPAQKLEFYNILPGSKPLTINQEKNIVSNYLALSKEYYVAGDRIIREIQQSTNDNLKRDTWILAGLFMLRQSIELILKAKIYDLITNKMTIQKELLLCKHNLDSLFNVLNRYSNLQSLTSKQREWLKKYFKECEIWDNNSDLFRYPFGPSFYRLNPPSIIDIVATTSRMSMAYKMLENMFGSENETETPKDFKLPESSLFVEANQGIEASLTESFYDPNSYFKVIEGYLSASEFLLTTNLVFTEQPIYNPAIFSLRQLLELELKQLAKSKYIEICNIEFRMGSHRIYKDFWRKLEPILLKTGNSKDIDNPVLNSAKFIEDFEILDKYGDFFRYPAGYNHQPHILQKELDPINILFCVRAISNLISGCDSMFDDYTDAGLQDF